MIQKEFVQREGRQVALVSFTLPDSVWADTIYLVGDFNKWQRTEVPMHRDRRGEWFIAIELDIGHAYQFRYLCDNNHWMNDSNADAYVPNPHGTDNFVVVTDPGFESYHGNGWQPDDEVENDEGENEVERKFTHGALCWSVIGFVQI